MEEFRSNNMREFRDRGESRGGYGGAGRGGFRNRGESRGYGGRDSFRDRDSRGSNRRSFEMHDATCDKCGKRCEVPFRPTGSKPVLCSDCFRKDGDSGGSFSSRSSTSQPGISPEQFNQLNEKLDKILKVLESLELDEEAEEETEEAKEDSE